MSFTRIIIMTLLLIMTKIKLVMIWARHKFQPVIAHDPVTNMKI